MAEAIDDRKKLLEDPSISNAQKAALVADRRQSGSVRDAARCVESRASGIVRGRQACGRISNGYGARIRCITRARASSVRIGRSRSSATSCMSTRTTRSSRPKILQGGITLGGRPLAEGETPDPTYDLPMFIMSDPPKHDLQRGVVAPVFLPRQIAALESLIRERAGTILDNLPRNEEFNWVRHVSVELTGQMLATLFDIPLEDRQKLIYWSDATSNLGNPEYFDYGGGRLQGAVGMRRVFHGAVRTTQERAAEVGSHFGARARRVDEEHAAERIPRQHPAVDRRRQRHHAQFDFRRTARAESESGGIRQAARESVTDSRTWCPRSSAGSRR